MTLDIAPGRRAHLAAIGRIGGLTTSSRNNMAELSAQGRRSFRDSFLTGHSCRVCPNFSIPEGLDDTERARRADAAYRLHFARMAAA